jgi:hypothetical protein
VIDAIGEGIGSVRSRSKITFQSLTAVGTMV